MILRRRIDHQFGYYGAILDTSRMDAAGRFHLELVLRVNLVQNGEIDRYPNRGRTYYCDFPNSMITCLDPIIGEVADSEGRVVRVADWPRQQWVEFCREYRNIAMDFWNNRFVLNSYHRLNPAFQAQFDAETGRTNPTEVLCKFRLDIVRGEANAHTNINVYNLAREIDFQTNSTRFRMNSEDYTEDVNQIRYNTLSDIDPHLAGVFTSQIPAIHEIGHSLGLDHIGVNEHIPGCSSNNRGSLICYGNTRITAENVMGRGSALSWHEAMPWRRAISELTSTSINSWNIQQTRTPEPESPLIIEAGGVVFED